MYQSGNVYNEGGCMSWDTWNVQTSLNLPFHFSVNLKVLWQISTLIKINNTMYYCKYNTSSQLYYNLINIKKYKN